MKNTDFVQEPFTAEEEKILNQYFTNTDKPVFGLINLPDVIKGALFARYSRSGKSLRRLFLDEFYSHQEQICTLSDDNLKIERATTLYDKMILDFGDDSVAQLGGAHLACEQVSNILAKFIEKGRIAAYLEQSTRYVYYNEKRNGRYHYFIPPEIQQTACGEKYIRFMDQLFDTYSEIRAQLLPELKAGYPCPADMPKQAWESTIKAQACDVIRGLLPAATRTNLGIFANGQYYEYLLIRMFASGNEEIMVYADLMLTELRKMIPSFLTRVDLENRGKMWSRYLKENHLAMAEVAEKISQKPENLPAENTVDLVAWEKDALDKVVVAALYEYTFAGEEELQAYVGKLSPEQKTEIVRRYCGNRRNRRHKPGRAFESVVYNFEVLSDYGAFRDLQRHRMLTIQWQKLSACNGYFIPRELEQYPALRQMYITAMEQAKEIYEEIRRELGTEIAQYAVPLAYRMRYTITMNLREAFHLIELRTQKQGHYSYRKICLEMYRLMRDKAGHRYFTDEMNFVDSHFYEHSREDAEKQKEKKRQQIASGDKS